MQLKKRKSKKKGGCEFILTTTELGQWKGPGDFMRGPSLLNRIMKELTPPTPMHKPSRIVGKYLRAEVNY